jgi:hypothetical protein
VAAPSQNNSVVKPGQFFGHDEEQQLLPRTRPSSSKRVNSQDSEIPSDSSAMMGASGSSSI